MAKFSQQIRWNITQSVTLTSIFYFLYFSGKTCLFPYITLYFRNLGLTGFQTGIICGAKSAVWFIAAPFWTVMAKRFGRTRLILGTSMLIAVASNLSLTLISPVDNHSIAQDCSFLSGIASNSIINTSDVNESNSVNSLIGSNLDDDVLLSSTISSVSDQPITKAKQMPMASTSSTKLLNELKNIEFNTATTKYVDATIYPIPTTSINSLPETSTLSLNKLALNLYPKIVASSPQTADDIKDVIAHYKEIADLPEKKKHIVIKKIISFLKKDNSEQQVTSPFQPTIKSTLISKTHTKGKSSLQTLLKELTQSLKDPFLRKKSLNSKLTVSRFINNYSATKGLPQKAKRLLAQMMELQLLNTSDHHSLNKRSILNFANLTSTPADIVHEVTHPKPVGVLDDSPRFLSTLLPSLKDNLPTFFIVCLIVVAGELLAAPIELLSDNSFYELLDELDSTNRYGRHKVFAVIGVMVSAVAISSAVFFSPCYTTGIMSGFNLHFYAFATLVCLAFLVVPFYPTYDNKSSQHSSINAVSICPSCRLRLCTECRRILLLLTVLIVGIMQAAMHDFLLWQISDLPQASELVYGSYVSANALASLLAIPIGQRVTSHLASNVTVPLSLAAIAVQMLLCSFINNAWLVVPLQALCIFGVPFLWIVINSELKLMMMWHDDRTSLRTLDQIHVFARSSQKRSLYIAYLCVYQGLAFAIGSVISGISYDTSGGSLIPFLRTGAAVVGAWACFCLFVQCCCMKKSKHRKYSKLLEDSDDELETFNLKDRREKSDINKSSLSYSGNNNKVGESRKKRRTKKMDDYASTSDEDDLEKEWSVMSLRKDTRHM